MQIEVLQVPRAVALNHYGKNFFITEKLTTLIEELERLFSEDELHSLLPAAITKLREGLSSN